MELIEKLQIELKGEDAERFMALLTRAQKLVPERTKTGYARWLLMKSIAAEEKGG